MRCTIHMVSARRLLAVHRGRPGRPPGLVGARREAARRARHAGGRRRGARLPGRAARSSRPRSRPGWPPTASTGRSGPACSSGWTWCGCRRPAPGARRGRTCTGWPSTPCPVPDPAPSEAAGPGRAGRAATCAAFGPASAGDVAVVLRLERHGHPGGAGRAAAAPVPRRAGRRAGRRAATRRCRPADTPAPVRFLGQWDAVLLVHARRGQILPEQLPAAGVRHVDPAVGAHLPGRRAGGRHLALRRRARSGASRSTSWTRRSRAAAGRGGGPAGRLPPRRLTPTRPARRADEFSSARAAR